MSKLIQLPEPSDPIRNGAGAELTYRGVPDGPGSEVILLPRFRHDVLVDVHAWSTGFGDPDYEGCTANLILRIENEQPLTARDEAFSIYQLDLFKNFNLPAGKSCKIAIQYDNHLATEAGDPAHGVIAKIKAVA